MADPEDDLLAQAWGFKDAAELEALVGQALPGYAEARKQADQEMADFERRMMEWVDQINKMLPDGVQMKVAPVLGREDPDGG